MRPSQTDRAIGIGRVPEHALFGLVAWLEQRKAGRLYPLDDSELTFVQQFYTQTRPFLRNMKGKEYLRMPTTTKRTASKREVLEPHKGDKRYVRRKADGTFGKTVDMGKSLSSDKRTTAKTKVPKGQGDKGDTR